MSFVYWITDDITKDKFDYGYIGITTKTISNRNHSHLMNYKRFLKTGQAGCKKLYSIVKSLGGWDNLIFVGLCESNLEYCLSIENKLRPEPNIGWNTRVGGDYPIMYKRKTSDETKIKLAIVRKSWVMSEKSRLKLSLDRKGAGNPMYGTLPWDDSNISEISNATWLRADEIYQKWADDKIATKRMVRVFPTLNYWTIDTIIRKFKKGWCPLNDQSWIKYKENYVNSN